MCDCLYDCGRGFLAPSCTQFPVHPHCYLVWILWFSPPNGKHANVFGPRFSVDRHYIVIVIGLPTFGAIVGEVFGERSFERLWSRKQSIQRLFTIHKCQSADGYDLNERSSSARGSKYSYTYESHIDTEPLALSPPGGTTQFPASHDTTASSTTSFSPAPQPYTNGHSGLDYEDHGRVVSTAVENGLERHSTSTQKQIPVNPDDIFFDADGNPIINGYDAQHLSEYDPEEGLGIDLSRTYISEHEEYSSPPSSSSAPPPPQPQLGGYADDSQYYNMVVPSAPGVPQVIEISNANVSLAWLRPDRDGTGGEILGYRVQFRRSEGEPWEPAHDDLLGETECKITNLDPLDSYHFRVVAANSTGFGPPSESCAPIQLSHSPGAGLNGGMSGEADMRNGTAVDYTTPAGSSAYNHDYLNMPAPPTKPIVVDVDGDRAVIEWRHLNTEDASGKGEAPVPIIGFMIEYRPAGTSNWIPSNDYPVPGFRHQVENLRPNGEYEFRVMAKDEDGRISAPSLSSGLVRIRPAVPVRSHQQYNLALRAPGQPQVADMDTTWVHLQWTEGGDENGQQPVNGSPPSIAYLLERREIGDPEWVTVGPSSTQTATEEPFYYTENQCRVDNLHPDASYEFRVSTVLLSDGSRSAPSDPSDVIRLRPTLNYNTTAAASRKVPERPSPPEYLDFDGGTSVTLCWLPAQSVLPVQGYEVEFRDVMQDATTWYKLTDQLVRSCKTTVGYLIYGHQYQFRVIAKNAIGYSQPSDASPLITIGAGTLKDTKYVEAERHAAVALLQDEMVRESPPLPDRDDSPPPIYRQPTGSNLQWRDPTLKEVIDYLKSNDQVVVQDASGYLQHLTFNNDAMKEETRNYGGIPNLIQLLKVPNQNPEILRNACGCLKNLAFGKENDVNKKHIYQAGGIKALAQVIQKTQSAYVKEEATGALWNMSSCDDLKEPILDQSMEIVINCVVIPFSGLFSNQIQENGNSASKNSNVFRNGTGILRNVSACKVDARKRLRNAPHLIDALLHFLAMALEKNQLDNRSVENCICLLRNLSYRVQEVVDPKYDPNRQSSRHSQTIMRNDRSKSAPSGSPKAKAKSKKLFKSSKKDQAAQPIAYPVPSNGKSLGASRLWHPDTVKLYLRILQESADPEILEASAAAIQNLAACQFEGSMLVRATVRTEKGLPILVELLRLKEDKVVCAVVTALRNLALDEKNLDLIGRYAMKELLSKLPAPGQTARNPQISDATIGAVLGILWEAVRSSVELTVTLHETLQGTERLRTLTKSYPAYGRRVCKYASQVLYMMWQHKELHDTFRRAGLKESDFYSGTLPRSGKKGANHGGAGAHDAATLARPISSQGAERPAKLQQLQLDESVDSGGRYAHSLGTPNSGVAAAPSPPVSAGPVLNGHNTNPMSSRSVQNPPQAGAASHYQQPSNYSQYQNGHRAQQAPGGEPLYAAVHKRNGHHAPDASVESAAAEGGDSWV
ncbi:fibronectin type III domain-containing protein [Ditylenchus destructor]|nr:fibronectin type III domain-containing protein [Ditylenchus destructor]